MRDVEKELALQKDLQFTTEALRKERDEANIELQGIREEHRIKRRELSEMSNKVSTLEGLRDRISDDIENKKKVKEQMVREMTADEQKLAKVLKAKNDEIIALNRVTTSLETNRMEKESQIFKSINLLKEHRENNAEIIHKNKLLSKRKKMLVRDANIAEHKYRKYKEEKRELQDTLAREQEAQLRGRKAIDTRERDVVIIVTRLKRFCKENNLNFNINV